MASLTRSPTFRTFQKNTSQSPKVLVEDCEDVFNEVANANVVVTVDADKRVGAFSNKFVIAAAAAAGETIAAEAIAALNLSGAFGIRMWIKCSVAAADGNLQLLLGETALIASPTEVINIPALAAGVWREVLVPLASAGASRDAIISVGLRYTVDLGACDVFIDDLRAVYSQTAASRNAANAVIGSKIVRGAEPPAVNGQVAVALNSSIPGTAFRNAVSVGIHGRMPAGTRCTPAGVLTGTPAAGTAGTYTLIANGVGMNGRLSSQAFNLVIAA